MMRLAAEAKDRFARTSSDRKGLISLGAQWRTESA
jgi:hypothetical protein